MDFLLSFLLTLSLLSLTALFLRHRRRNHPNLPPGSLGLPFIGETFQLISAYKSENPEPFIDDRARWFGPIFKTHVFGEPTVFSSDPETNRFILQNEGKLFECSYPSSICNLLGKHSLLLMKGSLHKKMHSLTMSFANSLIIRDHLLVDIDRLIRLNMDNWTGRVLLIEEAKKEEHDQIRLRKKGSTGALEWTDYKSMPFTQCVVNETLRVENIVSGIFRTVMTEVNINGYTIPKGWKVFASFRAVHLDQDRFKAAQTFNPWRWQQSNSGAPPSSVNVFTPFKGGPRLCPGYELARVELSVSLHHLLQLGAC